MVGLVDVWSCNLIEFEQCKLFAYLHMCLFTYGSVTHPSNSNSTKYRVRHFIATLSGVTVRQYGSTVPYGPYAYLTYRNIEVRYLQHGGVSLPKLTKQKPKIQYKSLERHPEESVLSCVESSLWASSHFYIITHPVRGICDQGGGHRASLHCVYSELVSTRYGTQLHCL